MALNSNRLSEAFDNSSFALDPDKGLMYNQKEVLDNYNQIEREQVKTAQDATEDMQSAISNVGGRVNRGGGLAGNTGYLSIQRPYLIMSIPNLSIPDNYGHYYGYPCNMTVNLGTLSGFTVVKDCHLDGFSCTKTELSEIERLLKQGVIL